MSWMSTWKRKCPHICHFAYYLTPVVFLTNQTICQNQIGPDICIISETFERERKRLDSVLNARQFKSISYYRKNRAPGGGCAIVYNENRFSVLKLDITAPEEIESCWALFTPRCQDNNLKVKRIAVGSYYISPRSRHKQETIDHIIDSIHILRAKYDNDVNFLVAGDFNRVNIDDILDSYGALKQIISVPTRKTATLEIVLTDLHTMFHPPTTIPPPSHPYRWTQTSRGRMGTMMLWSWHQLVTRSTG